MGPSSFTSFVSLFGLTDGQTVRPRTEWVESVKIFSVDQRLIGPALFSGVASSSVVSPHWALRLATPS